MRMVSALLATGLLSSPALADEHGKALYEHNTTRFGQAYLTVPADDAAGCEMVCRGEEFCQVWTFKVLPYGEGGKCDIKSYIGAPSYLPGATSGIAFKFQRMHESDKGSEEELLGAAEEGPAKGPALRPEPVSLVGELDIEPAPDATFTEAVIVEEIATVEEIEIAVSAPEVEVAPAPMPAPESVAEAAPGPAPIVFAAPAKAEPTGTPTPIVQLSAEPAPAAQPAAVTADINAPLTVTDFEEPDLRRRTDLSLPGFLEE